MRILDNVNSSEDIKELDIYSLNVLAGEIREFLIENISNTGGHLSSNLGTVELTLALHKVFDVYNDKIVWDVGHQAYTHKILTGRKDRFPTLRQKGGLSGFPKTEESPTDAFNTGHSSTSISAALGFAVANRVKNKSNYAVAVIGDGALTGGLAYEAINHAGSQRTPLIVVLNDNGMSISKNVGGLSRHLNRIRNNSCYFTLKDDIKRFLDKTPLIGKVIKRGIQSFKRGIKNVVFQNEIFENMGMTYMGPVDGHNIEEMMVVLNQAKKLNEPVIVHIHTTKGKGYEFAEKNPDVFHGIQSFDLHTGEVLSEKRKSYSDLFGDVICRLAKDNGKIVGISAAMPSGTGFMNFANKFKDRFFDVGIAEQHAVTFSAALAKDGLIPVFAVYSSFLQRAYDQILHDVALQNLHVIFAIDRAGVVGSDGETHQGIYDLSYLSHIPNIQILAPSSASEMRLMLEYAINDCNGPVAVRYPRGEATDFEFDNNGVENRIECGKGRLIKSGSEVLIISIGTMLSEALAAAEILEKSGVFASVFDARFLKPFDKDSILNFAKNCSVIATVEDNTRHGGLFGIVSEILDRKIIDFNFGDEPICHGTIKQLRGEYGVDAKSIAEKILCSIKKIRWTTSKSTFKSLAYVNRNGNEELRMSKQRLDVYLTENNLVQSRSLAQSMIMAGNVFVDNQKADKAGMTVTGDEKIEVRGKILKYVSRGGLKLEKALEVFPININNKVCMDIGASTGGFTDCMLQNGASKVFAVDVGYGQLAWSLRQDERVINMERTNIRYVNYQDINEYLDFFSVDVAFISLKLVLPVAFELLSDGGEGVCLIKPQFEAGKEKVGKKGVVRDINVHKEVIKNVLEFTKEIGFCIKGVDFSPVRGPEGNIEYLMYVKKCTDESAEIDTDKIVDMSHKLAI